MITEHHIQTLKESTDADSFIKSLMPGVELLLASKKCKLDVTEVTEAVKNFELFTSSASIRRYRAFEIPKKSGGSRKIEAPVLPLKTLQRIILLFLEKIYEAPAEVHGFVKDRSIITNALPHSNKAHVLNIDIEQFFNSVRQTRVRALFQKHLEFSDYSSLIVSKLLCHRGCLPMGAPTSPLVTNLIFQRADKRILAASRKMDVTYTRYADDLSFSCDSVESLHRTKRLIAVIIRQEGFKINSKKTRLLHRADCQSVTGLVVNDKVNVLRAFRRTTRALCHRLDVSMKEHGDANKALITASEYHAMTTGQKDVRPPLSHLNFINGRQAFEYGVRENSQSSKNHDQQS